MSRLRVTRFPQCPTSTTGRSPPTHPPTTPASPTSARRTLTSSPRCMARSPVPGAQTGMCSMTAANALELCGIYTERHSRHSWLIAFQMFLFFPLEKVSCRLGLNPDFNYYSLVSSSLLWCIIISWHSGPLCYRTHHDTLGLLYIHQVFH